MPIQWRPFRPRVVGPQFLRVPPNRFVCFSSRPEEHTSIALHWLPSGRGSFPCMGEECTLHDLPVELHTYSVVLYTTSLQAPAWRPGILDLGKPDKEIVQLDLRGKILEVGRETDGDKSTGVAIKRVLKLDEERKPKLLLHRDAKPYLLARWNMQEVEEYFAPRPDGEQKRLDFMGEGLPESLK